MAPSRRMRPLRDGRWAGRRNRGRIAAGTSRRGPAGREIYKAPAAPPTRNALWAPQWGVSRRRRNRRVCGVGVRRPVSRVLSPGAPKNTRWMAIHLDPPSPAGSRDLPGWRTEDSSAPRRRHPYSILLPAGLAAPPLSPGARWALTPPFHPCPGGPGRFDFCGAFPEDGA